MHPQANEPFPHFWGAFASHMGTRPPNLFDSDFVQGSKPFLSMPRAEIQEGVECQDNNFEEMLDVPASPGLALSDET